jgi:cytochrome c oxidase cbb3-type subunit 3
MVDRLAAASLQQIAADPVLLDFARAQGRSTFAENCAPCHGAGGGGGRGYPNLNDDDWIWGGTLDEIAQTIRHGVRSADAETRQGAAMPAFGRDGVLKRADIDTVAEYARSLAGLPVDAKTDLAAGKKIFADNCAVCHGEAGKGKRELGAPNLSDAIWLYGSDHAAIVNGVWNGRGGVMPAWAGRLDDVTIKALAVYVHSLGGGEK